MRSGARSSVTDIVERLRQGIKASNLNDWDFERTEADMEEGADEIERLRAALEEVKDLVFGANHSETRYPLARAALEGK